MEFVSVVIPTYNRGNLIIRAINSVLEQTYSNIEVIVVDDCSSDNTREIVQSIKDNRVRYLCLEKNMGACAARNRGIEASRGEYIAFQDSDDEWHPNKLEVQMKKMKDAQADVSFCNFIKVFKNEDKKREFPLDVPEGFIEYESLLKKSIVSTQCIIAKKSCFDEVRFDTNLPRLQDWDVILELSKKYSVYHVDNALVNMYVQSDSISSHPEKGVIALKYLWNKNKKQVDNDKEVSYLWNIYLGNYKLACGENPSSYYKNALKIHITRSLIIKYILSKIGIISIVYRKTGRLER